MKFQELKKSLTNIKQAYFIKGSDAFLRQKSVEMIVNHALKIKDLNLATFNDENTDISAIISACQSIPMMDEHRVVVLKDVAVKKADEVTPLVKYLQKPLISTVLIVVDSVGNSALKKIEPLCEIVDCSPMDTMMLAKLVATQLNAFGVKINSDALERLVSYCNNDYTRINNEVLKLGNLLGSGGLVTLEIVEQNVHREVEYDIFELSNAVASKNGKKAMQIVEQLLLRKESPQMLIMLIVGNFRRMFFALSSKESNIIIANKLGIKEYAVKIARETGARFTLPKLKKALDLGAKLDYQIKAGEMSDRNALYYFIASVVSL